MLTTESPVNVGSEERDVLLRRGVSSVTYDRHLRAWTFFSMAFELPTDIGRFRRSTFPRQFWEDTVEWYIPQTAGQQVTLRQQLTNFQVSKTSDPVQKLLEIEYHAQLMRDAGIKVDDQAAYGGYVADLPSPEYQPEIRELKKEQVFDREHIIRLVRAAHELLKDNKKKSPSAFASISDGRNGGGGRGHPGAKRGGRGGGRGRSNSGNGKAKSGDDDGKDAAEDGKKPAKGPMCYNCHVKGHFAADCKTKVCQKCGGRVHVESKCPSPADMETALAVELPGSEEESTTSSVGAARFMAEEVDAVCEHPQAHVASGKCDGSVPTSGVEGLAMQVGEAMEGWYFDTGASRHISPSSEGMTNFHPCNKSLRVANGVTLPIEGKGNLVVEFQSGLESVRLQLHGVAYVPKLSYRLLSLSKAVEQGHKYIGDKNGLTMMFKSGKKLLVPNVRNMYLTYGYRPESDVEQACAVIAPGLLPTTGVDINHHHRTTAHTHPRLLRATAEQQGVKLDPKTNLLPCVGCSTAKGLSARLNKTTECRSDKKMGRIFVDESGEKPVASKGGKKYSIIFRDETTRMSWIYFMRKKSESLDALDQFFADTREYGPPKIIRTDDAPQLKAGKFDEICRKLHIKKEFTSANTPQLNGVAERGLTLIEKLAKASAYQAKVSFVGMDLPPIDRLWTDNHHNARDVLNRSATKSNKGMTTPYEMWHGVKPSPTLIQWLQPCFYRVKRKHKTDAQAKPGFYVGPARNHPRDSMRIYSQQTGEIVISRDVTWRHVPTPPLTPVPQSISAPSERGETESTADESREGREGTSHQGDGEMEESDSDDDLEVTWESDKPDAAEVTDDEISDKPVAGEGSSPSTVIS